MAEQVPARTLWTAIGGEPEFASIVAPTVTTGALPSSFPVEAFGSAAFATVGLAVAELVGAPHVAVDGAAAATAIRSEQALRIGDEPPEAAWDPLSRIVRARDGWVRLHGNYAQHRRAIAEIFGTEDPEAVAAAIAALPASEVELRLHGVGGVAAAAHSLADWATHSHGRIVADRPLVETRERRDHAPRPWRLSPFRALAGGAKPLAGLRVLEVARVIAAPTAGRALAWFGADVLRIESPFHDELRTIVVDQGVGKRSTTLDLQTTAGMAAFRELLEGADVLLHGLRPEAFQGLRLDPGQRAAIAPGLIDASLSAYGPGGPWSGRRGFDSLVQLSAGLGLAEAEAAGAPADAGPRALPCQILDHATGLVLAAATIRAVGQRAQDGVGRSVRASLARTAAELASSGCTPFDGAPPTPAPTGSLRLTGPHGVTHHAPFPVSVEGAHGGWDAGPPLTGQDRPAWT